MLFYCAKSQFVISVSDFLRLLRPAVVVVSRLAAFPLFSSSLIQDDIDRVLLPEGMVRDRIEKMVKECRMRLKHTHTIT